MARTCEVRVTLPEALARRLSAAASQSDGSVDVIIEAGLLDWERRQSADPCGRPCQPEAGEQGIADKHDTPAPEERPRTLGHAPHSGMTAGEREAWLEENKAAFESSNAYVERNGLPLARQRLF